ERSCLVRTNWIVGIPGPRWRVTIFPIEDGGDIWAPNMNVKVAGVAFGPGYVRNVSEAFSQRSNSLGIDAHTAAGARSFSQFSHTAIFFITAKQVECCDRFAGSRVWQISDRDYVSARGGNQLFESFQAATFLLPIDLFAFLRLRRCSTYMQTHVVTKTRQLIYVLAALELNLHARDFGKPFRQ